MAHFKKFTILATILCGTALLATAQTTVPGAFKSSWIGNTFHSAGKDQWPTPGDPGDDWVQNYIDCMTVTDNGTCYTTSNWDEGGRRNGIYKDGDVIGNGGSVGNCGSAGGYTINGTKITGNGKTISDAGTPKAIAMGKGPLAGKLIVADIGTRNQILIYDVSGTGTPAIVETIGATGGIASKFVIDYDLPACTNSASFPAGTYGPGVYHPLKLWGMTGVGCDIQGRVFVSTSEMGSGIRCFKKVNDKWILDWKVENYFFVDNVFYDAESDAVDIYGVQEHFKMNFNAAAAGQEWSIYGYSLDRNGYPEDPRGIEAVHDGGEHALKGVIMREINGTRYLWTSGMTCQPPSIFKYKPGTEIAVPCGMFMKRDHRIYDLPITFWWPPQRPSTDKGFTMFWEDLNNNGKYEANEYTDQSHDFGGGDFMIDKQGNIWQGQNPITVWKATIKPNGNISYSSNNLTTYTITGIPNIGKIVYQEDKDRLVLETAACRDIDGGKVYVVNNWSKGNRQATFVSDLKTPNIRPADSDISSWTACGDYGFEVGWSTRAKVWVTDLRTGALVGTMEPGLDCGGIKHSGWVDIAAGIQAYQRSNGEYLVFVENDGIGSVIMYRWSPVACTVPVTGVSVSPSTVVINGIGTSQLTAERTPADACNKTIIWTSSNTSIATVSSKGIVSSVAPGTAIITATTQDGNFVATSEVTVNNASVTGVSVNPSSVTLGIGDAKQLTPLIEPANAFNTSVSWSSDNETVAKVSTDGLVTALALGSAKITVTTADGSHTAICDVTVSTIAVTGVSISTTTPSVSISGTRQLTAVIDPANASNKTVTWSSSDESVATVNSSGLVTGKAQGSATITVKTADGSFTAELVMQVIDHGDVVESFEYPVGDLAGKGSTTNGWGAAWVKNSGLMEIVDGNLGTDIGSKSLQTKAGTESANYTRELMTKWVDDGNDVWISFYIKRQNTTQLTWGGISLFNEGSELLFMGCPYGKSFVGFDNNPTNVPNTDVNHILVKLEMNNTADKDKAFMWVNYKSSTPPATSTALINTTWGGSGFTTIRIANSPDYSISYDRLRISNTFDITTGIEEETTDVLGIYPNPVTRFLNLSSDADNFTVYSIDGRIVAAGSGNKIDMQGLQPGVYFVKASLNGKEITRKVVKE